MFLQKVIGTAFSRAGDGLVKLDLTNEESVNELFKTKFDAIIHCAAERRPDVAAKNVEASKKLNESVPRLLAEISKQHGIFLIYISTDYVFDGKKPPYNPGDIPNPVNQYGKFILRVSKYNGEKCIESSGLENYVILRVPILYGKIAYLGEGAVDVLLKHLMSSIEDKKNGIAVEKTAVDNEQARFPTNTQDVARVLCEITEKRLIQKDNQIFGIAHFSAQDQYTKFEMCNVFAKCLKIDQEEYFEPLDPTTVTAAVDRPENSHLSNSVLEKWGIDTSFVSFDSWWENAISKSCFLV
ncbi:hypothetical protein BB560_005862 [Smittium megazygosporum]|uniref:RmlD-like substrate binding domain-containing protein n=1 Tax=Smittium megazygosporum TaxID=133381 RepID=A0A2T9YSR7_9FUNG|nr:hypothetical protein BB560_005862 [Smittium megazygosporum]